MIPVRIEENEESVTYQMMNDVVSIVSNAMGVSMSKARNLIRQGAVRVNDVVVGATHIFKEGDILKVGKGNFFKIKL